MKILFMGRKKSSAELLEWTVKNGHEIVGVLTDNHLPGSPTTKIANKYGLNIYTLEEIYEMINCNTIEIDLAISVVYWRKIKEPLISFPTYETINLHPAPLPEYKGTAGYNMAILENLEKWAITAHYINEDIDEGAIIKKYEFSTDSTDETAISLEEKSQLFIIALYKNIINLVSRDGMLNTTPNIGGQYISRIKMEDMKEIKDDDDIDTKIRAFWFPPYNGAYILINSKKYTLINEYILNKLSTCGTNLIIPNKK